MSTSSPVVELVEDHVVVALVGEVDLAVRRDLLDSYDFAITLLEVLHLLVDASRAPSWTPQARGTLAGALNKVRARGGTISVVGANARVANLMHITYLDCVVTVLPEAEVPVNGR